LIFHFKIVIKIIFLPLKLRNMATYKKRGYKPKNRAEKEVALEDGSTTAEVFSSLDEGASKTEAWVENNQKSIFTLVAVIAVGVLGYIAYQKFVFEPKQTEAANEVYQASSYFEQALTSEVQKDSLFSMALNGNAGRYGLLDIADKFDGTPAGDLARYQAGIAYFNLSQYDKAIQFLDGFSSSDAMMTPVAKGVIGDSFAQLEQYEEALNYYQQAADLSTNDLTTPRYLLKAGTTALGLGQNALALKSFTRILDEFEDASEATQAKAYKAQAEAAQ
jgi:tetratricopeptide (TPR) repeat protein